MVKGATKEVLRQYRLGPPSVAANKKILFRVLTEFIVQQIQKRERERERGEGEANLRSTLAVVLSLWLCLRRALSPALDGGQREMAS